MYNGQRTIINNAKKGSTRLHGDYADALNYMAWADTTEDDHPGAAVWDILPADKRGAVGEFIKRNASLCGDPGWGHPIHSHQVYLTPLLLDLLAKETGIIPFRIMQQPGDVVFIPVGCIHQVRAKILYFYNLMNNDGQVANLVDSIKIAIDFVYHGSLQRCQDVQREFRDHRIRIRGGDDVLRIYHMMWYAWHSLSSPSFAICDDMVVDEVPPHEAQMSVSSDNTASIREVINPSTLTNRARTIKRRATRRNTNIKPEHKFHCFSCRGFFNRGGLIQHLWAFSFRCCALHLLTVHRQMRHTSQLSLTDDISEAIRKPKQVPDSEFATRLSEYLNVSSEELSYLQCQCRISGAPCVMDS